jgi:hypothetical protein
MDSPRAPASDPPEAQMRESTSGADPAVREGRARRLFSRLVRRRRMQLPSWALVGGVSMALFFSVYLLDYFKAPVRPPFSPIGLLLRFDVETAQNALGNLAQVVVAVLGIVITVVSIVVQLASTRYTPRIASMFFRDKQNIFILGFFVVTCILSLWVSLSVSRLLVPRSAIAVTLVLVSLSLLLIIPYFSYVFNFLDPEKIILRIRDETLLHSVSERERISERQQAVLDGIEQLSDVAVNAITSRDQLIAASAVDALKDLGIGYLPLKVAQSASWLKLHRNARTRPDFVAMAPESLDQLSEEGVWVEWKVLRQLLNLYTVAIAELPDIGHLIAIDIRYLGEASLEVGDLPALRLTIKFFNTLLRTSLNSQKVRSAYNVLHQYRQLAEKVLSYGYEEVLADIAENLRYYARTALHLHIGFITETIAYDLATLCELAAGQQSEAHDAMLGCLLSLDDEGEPEAHEVTLRGVRKAQVKLATAYLELGNKQAARRIFLDMKDERPERLRSIYDELLAVHSKDFWEIVDRGSNFDYLEPSRKDQLEVFFSWFWHKSAQSKP